MTTQKLQNLHPHCSEVKLNARFVNSGMKYLASATAMSCHGLRQLILALKLGWCDTQHGKNKKGLFGTSSLLATLVVWTYQCMYDYISMNILGLHSMIPPFWWPDIAAFFVVDLPTKVMIPMCVEDDEQIFKFRAKLIGFFFLAPEFMIGWLKRKTGRWPVYSWCLRIWRISTILNQTQPQP